MGITLEIYILIVRTVDYRGQKINLVSLIVGELQATWARQG